MGKNKGTTSGSGYVNGTVSNNGTRVEAGGQLNYKPNSNTTVSVGGNVNRDQPHHGKGHTGGSGTVGVSIIW